jgi:carboxylesterase
MRPLGELLRRAGWTVHGLLLPGFGAELDTLFRWRHEDWVRAVRDALSDLRRNHGPVLLIGYSMGAALALSVAASDRPDGLVLLAPFWRLGSRLQRGIGVLLRPFLPRYLRPLRKADLTDARLRHAIAKYLPGIDLDDPQTQQGIRDLAIPVSLLGQVSKTGQDAIRCATSITTPTLIVQGRRDKVSEPASTNRLVRRLRCEYQYEMVDADHELVDAHQEGWDAVGQAVLRFACSLLEPRE